MGCSTGAHGVRNLALHKERSSALSHGHSKEAHMDGIVGHRSGCTTEHALARRLRVLRTWKRSLIMLIMEWRTAGEGAPRGS